MTRETWILIDEKHNWSNSSKFGSFTYYLTMMIISMKKKLTNQLPLSRDIHNQGILQSDWKRSTADLAQPKA